MQFEKQKYGQSARIAYLSWKIEIGQNGTEAKLDGD